MSNWKLDRERARAEREARKLERIMSSPLTRGESAAQASEIQASLVSTALALESLELLLVAKGILQPDELMARLAELVRERATQARAADAVEQPRIITPV